MDLTQNEKHFFIAKKTKTDHKYSKTFYLQNFTEVGIVMYFV